MGADDLNEPGSRPGSRDTDSSRHDLLAFALAIATSDRIESDQPIVALAMEVCRLNAEIRELLATDTRDTDEIPGFADTADRLAASVDRLCTDRASSLAGMLAKAEVAMNFRSFEGERAGKVALSLASDIHIFCEAIRD